MRKNGVNREIRNIDGGLCAPDGFLLHVIDSGITKEKTVTGHIGLLYAERRYPTAFVGTSNKTQGAAFRVTQRRIQNGYAQGMVLCSGEENIFSQEDERFAEMMCDAVSHKLKLDITDVGMVSIGNASQYILPALLENKAKELADGLGRFTFKSCLERKGLTAYGQAFKELSFTFDLGDYPCKIGALFSVSNKRAEYVEPMLCFMTTDVCISPAMLQKALETETRDTLEMLAKDGVTTPSDMTCIMSSCKAGNYKINQVDSEYKKFCNALHEVLVCISKEVVYEGRNSRKAFACCVTGAQSKPLSRKIAKAIAENASVKYHFGKGRVVPQDIVTIVSQYIDLLQTEELTISLSSATGSSVLYEDGASLSVLPEMQSYICAGGDLELIVRIGRGNYTATAYGCDLVECSKNNFEKNAEGALNV